MMRSTRRSTRRTLLAGGLIAVSISMLAACGSSDEPDSKSESSTLTGTATVPAKERRITVAVRADLTLESNVKANTRPAGAKPVLVRSVVVSAASDQFTIVLNRPAPAGGTAVGWVASKIQVESSKEPSDGADWDVKWQTIVLLFCLVIAAGLAAFAIAVRRRRDNPGEDSGLELVSFLKVSALITLAVLALVGVIITTKDNEANVAALFGLLGTIAGFLAGTQPATATEEVPGDPQVPAAPAAPGNPAAPAAPGAPGAPPAPARPRIIKRTLL
jgi:hypothetical protein